MTLPRSSVAFTPACSVNPPRTFASKSRNSPVNLFLQSHCINYQSPANPRPFFCPCRMSLKLSRIRKSYREPGGALLPVLNIEQFAIAPGEQVALVGQSGGGKTTLLNVISGITLPIPARCSSTTSRSAGFPNPPATAFARNGLASSFRPLTCCQQFTALENVLLGMSFSGKADRDFARQLLERVGLSHRLHHRPPQMSVGEQQRVAVARALGNRPRLMLADEPTANVDAANQEKFLSLLQTGCRELNVALLLVTHSPEAAGRFLAWKNSPTSTSGRSGMNLFSFALKSIRQRALASSLTALSVALGVALMDRRADCERRCCQMFNQTGTGYDLVVGPRGSRFQLILSSIYRIDRPSKTCPGGSTGNCSTAGSRKGDSIALGDQTEIGQFPMSAPPPST